MATAYGRIPKTGELMIFFPEPCPAQQVRVEIAKLGLVGPLDG